MSILETHPYQCTSWRCCERLRSASVNFVLKTLSKHLPISWWVIYQYKHTRNTLSVQQFLTQKWHEPHAPPSWFTLSRPSNFFFVSLDEKSPQREMFYQCGRGETKNGRNTERHKNQQVQKLFWAVEVNILTGVLHQAESTLTEV